MLELINKKDLVKKYNKLKIDYVDYCKWSNEVEWLNKEEPEHHFKYKYYGISTTTAKIRDEKEWNTKGREIYDKLQLDIHIKKIINILKQIPSKNFLVQYSGLQFPKWFPNTILSKKVAKEKIRELRSFNLNMAVKNFEGGFILHNDVKFFLKIFIDYPFLFKFQDIDCIDLNQNLLFSITHHLCVDFISSEKTMMNTIKKLCKKEKLDFIIYNTNES